MPTGIGEVIKCTSDASEKELDAGQFFVAACNPTNFNNNGT